MLEINLKTKAAAQTTQAFNSMCRFGEHLLGATADGLFALGGYNDHGVQIPARIDSGQFDMGMFQHKRFRMFYFGIETAGKLKLSIFGDGVLMEEYTVEGGTGIQSIRVPISRAAKGSYWQWRIENIDGAFFALHSVRVSPVILTRGA